MGANALVNPSANHKPALSLQSQSVFAPRFHRVYIDNRPVARLEGAAFQNYR